ncbi:hypothetical protein D9M71_580830 [compost metagenome]
MNLRTFTPSRMFFSIFFCAQLIVVMLDTGKAVDLAGHQHQLEQVAFHFGHQSGDALDHLAGQVLIVLGQQNVVEVPGDLAVTFGAVRQETVDALDQVTELRCGHFAAHEALPVGAQGLGLAGQVVEHRGAFLDQVHGAVGCALGEPDHVRQALGGVGYLRHLLGLRHGRVDLETDDGTVQLAGQLADFLVQAAVAGLVQLVDQLHRLAETAPLQAFDQLLGMLLQGRFELAQRGL